MTENAYYNLKVRYNNQWTARRNPYLVVPPLILCYQEWCIASPEPHKRGFIGISIDGYKLPAYDFIPFKEVT